MTNSINSQPFGGRRSKISSPACVLVTGLSVVVVLTACGCQSYSGYKSAAVTPQSSYRNTNLVSKSMSGISSLASRVSSGFRRPSESETAPVEELDGKNFASVQIAMGESLERQGNLKEAESAYQAALRNQADNPVALHRLALVKEKLGEGAEAGELLKKSSKLAPADLEILCDLGYWYSLREQADEARRCYLQALKQDPNFARAHNNLGVLLALEGDSTAALAQFRAAGLSEAEARSNLGFAFMLQSDWQSASQELATAQRLNPELKNASILAQTLKTVSNQVQQGPALAETEELLNLPQVNEVASDFDEPSQGQIAEREAGVANFGSDRLAQTTPATPHESPQSVVVASSCEVSNDEMRRGVLDCELDYLPSTLPVVASCARPQGAAQDFLEQN